MGSEALGDLAHAVLVDFADRFRAGLRKGNPPADVPAMKVHLLPGARLGTILWRIHGFTTDV